ncbi:unnamed protein product [Brassica rapa]|uniref:Uncharacterized protein n=2 Tax=Brassica TaxID=3705 RepID=A0A3P6AXS2_BRACM|nr:unnamed protein product [Brassica napus]CAG7866594.1 unnamed protein product [Brassica rapa]CAG7894576.1 unnamed protein product [Brassica rapa]CAG7903319.1 unnamed protein product [Brassica rapa]VDC90490.1 unnamed protein product [Brassica rapa]
MNSISMHLGDSYDVGQTVGNMSKSAEVMKLVNNLMEGSTNGCNYAGVHQRDD